MANLDWEGEIPEDYFEFPCWVDDGADEDSRACVAVACQAIACGPVPATWLVHRATEETRYCNG